MLKVISCNREIILDTISIIAFVLSVSQLIYGLLSNRTLISAKIYALEISKTENSVKHTFLMFFNNASSEPISIARVLIIDKSKNKHPCYLDHKWIGDCYYPKFPETDIPRTERRFSVDFPINISPKSAFTGCVKFSIPLDVDVFQDDNEIEFSIETNKANKTLKLKCPKPQMHIYEIQY